MENETYIKCPECKNEYVLEAYCFEDDPGHELCNGCWRSLSRPPDLGISVHEEIVTKERIS